MKRRSLLAGVGALALTASLGFGLDGAATQEGPIRIAALYNLTGGMSSIDAPALRGAQLKAEQVNKAGGVLGGRMIEIVPYDTRTDQAATATAAQEAVSEGVVAGIG